MTGWCISMIYLGGTIADWDRKVGFIGRVMWPLELGQRLGEFAFRGTQK